MAVPHEVEGQPASDGVALGPAYIARPQTDRFPPQVSLAIERCRLDEAIRVAVGELEALGKRSDPESAAILDFQIEMLLDEEISALALIRIDAGDSAALAWAGGLDGYIADIEASQDGFLAARAVDVIDIRNRVLAALTGRRVADFPEGSIFVGNDIAPSLFLAHDWSKGGGLALAAGSVASHVVLLARARSVPMVVGLGRLDARAGDVILLDGTRGRAVVNPPADAVPSRQIVANSETGGAETRHIGSVLQTADGISIGLWLNINDAAELEGIDPKAVQGIGLVRTEFLMVTPADVIDEERQYASYRRILSWAGDRPVTIRMLDLGGDKPMAGLGGAEGTTFLGVRGVRLLLARTEIARLQARALMRAGAHGNLRVLLPMVTVASELSAMSAIFREEAASLQRRDIAHAVVPIGIMVEVPATALTLDLFGDAAFFSFGTNDLAQYLAAAARDNSAVASLHEQAVPALFRLLRQSMIVAHEMEISASICGDIAGDPDYAARLLSAGLRAFSMAPSRLMRMRSAISALNADGSPRAGE